MSQPAAAPALRVQNLTVQFGGLQALAAVTLRVQPGSRHGILGPNGAGKTTLFNAITGFVKPASGQITIAGVDATRLPPHRRVALGLVRTFQITTLFPSLTAMENVLIGAQMQVGHQGNVWQSAHHNKAAVSLAGSLLEQLGLTHLADTPVGNIGYGEQRQLEIALALALKPKILLLDEPTAGLSVAETRVVSRLIKQLPPELTLILIEHDLEFVFNIADHLTVLYHGECIADGPADAIREDPVVREVYLGD